jgi:hypothetical protein
MCLLAKIINSHGWQIQSNFWLFWCVEQLLSRNASLSLTLRLFGKDTTSLCIYVRGLGKIINYSLQSGYIVGTYIISDWVERQSRDEKKHIVIKDVGVVHANVGQNVTPHNPSLGLFLYHFLHMMSSWHHESIHNNTNNQQTPPPWWWRRSPLQRRGFNYTTLPEGRAALRMFVPRPLSKDFVWFIKLM